MPGAAIDFIANGRSSGAVADRLLANNGHPCGLRPWIGRDGRAYTTQFLGNEEVLDKATGEFKSVPKYQKVLANSATLRYNEWISLDRTIVRATRAKLRLWNDLEAAGLGMTVPEGMAVSVLQYQSMIDAGNAQLDMDGVNEAERDRITYDLRGLPLPIVHADFSFTLREILQSRRFGTGIDTTMAEQSVYKIWSLIEKLTLGVLSTYSYAGYTIYGFRNYTYRITKTFTLPTAAGWTPDVFINELLDAIQALADLFFLGPYALYLSPGWSKFLDSDYSAVYGGETLRTRIAKITDISVLRKIDLLPNYELLLFQMDSDTIRAVTAMNIVPLQWETNGGMKVNFKLLGIKVPMLRRNSLDQTGIVHGTAA